MVVKDRGEMKTFGGITFGILIFKLMFCSGNDGLSKAKLEKIYKFDTEKNNVTDAKDYKIIKGEIIKDPTKTVWMKMEKPVENSKKDKSKPNKIGGTFTFSKIYRRIHKGSYVSNEIAVFKDLKNGKKDLFGECLVDMLNHGTYEGKKVLLVSGLGKNLKEHSSKPYSWDELSKMGPFMITALRFLHDRNYIHRNLKPEAFAFGTEENVAPLKNQVYLFDVGLAEKYRHPNGSHKEPGDTDEFFGETLYASRSAMVNMTQSRRDDMESLFYVLAYLAGFTKPFDNKELVYLYEDKYDFCNSPVYLRKAFQKSKIGGMLIFNAFLDFAQDLSDLFNESDYEIEPDYDDFIKCFDQGLSEKEIKAKYKFESLKHFKGRGSASDIGYGNTTTDPSNKTEVVMKLVKYNLKFLREVKNSLSFKAEVRAYKDLKSGLNNSLFRENVCDMLDHGIYDNRRAIITPRLGQNLLEQIKQNYRNGYPYDKLCAFARYAISALRFVHKRGYIHRDIKLENFAFGTVEVNKSDKSQADKPLKNQLYLFDFGCATKYRYANKIHKPHVRITDYIGTKEFMSRAALMKYAQSRRDDMESLMITLFAAATNRNHFTAKDEKAMLKRRNEFITKPGEILSTFKSLEQEAAGERVFDKRIQKAFADYAVELNKLFVSDEPKYFEKEPDYNAFCVCFGGKPGNNACAVE